MFTKNESPLDRVVRAVVGTGLIAASAAGLGLASGEPLGLLFGLVGAVLLFTAATGTCLLYKLVGFSTAKQH
jgi:hypothetical protein